MIDGIDCFRRGKGRDLSLSKGDNVNAEPKTHLSLSRYMIETLPGTFVHPSDGNKFNNNHGGITAAHKSIKTMSP